jgi:hypothetical protein
MRPLADASQTSPIPGRSRQLPARSATITSMARRQLLTSEWIERHAAIGAEQFISEAVIRRGFRNLECSDLERVSLHVDDKTLLRLAHRLLLIGVGPAILPIAHCHELERADVGCQ